jgi:hypothetical protein
VYEVCVFAGFELFDDSFEGVADGIEAARVHLLDQALDRGEDLLDRIEVRAVGRQVHFRAFAAFADTGDFVGGQVIAVLVPVSSTNTKRVKSRPA